MCCKDKKRALSQFIVGDSVPQTPWDFTHYGPKHGWMRREQCIIYTAPHASITSFGAQVASQQSPILRVGKNRIAKCRKNAMISYNFELHLAV